MKTLVQPMYFGQFYRFMLDNHPNMDVGDVRPYKTVMRYVQHRGYLITEGEEGGVVLVKKHQRANTAGGRPLRAIELLDTVARWARAAERDAKTSFQRQCAEEDQEEIELLRERCRRAGVGRNTPLKSKVIPIMPGNAMQRELGSYSGRNTETHAGDMFYPGGALTSDMEAHVRKISEMCDEDALDLEA